MTRDKNSWHITSWQVDLDVWWLDSAAGTNSEVGTYWRQPQRNVYIMYSVCSEGWNLCKQT